MNDEQQKATKELIAQTEARIARLTAQMDGLAKAITKAKEMVSVYGIALEAMGNQLAASPKPSVKPPVMRRNGGEYGSQGEVGT